MNVDVIIPALNEAGNIAQLVREAAKQPVARVIVSDNGSTDGTGALAAEAGAHVVTEPRRGYGYACAAGVAAATADILLFLDGDFSSLPEEEECQDYSSRSTRPGRPGSRLPCSRPNPARRNAAPSALRQLAHLRAHASPLHSGRHRPRPLPRRPPRSAPAAQHAGDDLRLAHRNDGKMRPVGRAHSRSAGQLRPRRAGQSKVSGTLRGSVLAAYYILGVTLRYAFTNQ